MVRDKRRKGDERPFEHNDSPLAFFPATDMPFRWLPRHGEPLCVGEWFSQHTIKALAYLPVYTALIVTAIILIQLFGVPFG